MRPPTSSRERPAPMLSDKMKAAFYWVTAVLSAAALVIALIKCFGAMNLEWPEIALLAAAVAGTVATLARQLPILHAVTVTILITVIGGGLAALNAKTGLPFGPYMIGANAGAKLFNVLPWAVPLLWPVAIISSRGVARLILRPWRKTKTYGFRLIGLAAVLAALFDFTFEPFASRVKHYWYWEPTNLPVTWLGAPLVDFLSWIVVTVLILSFTTPLMINKKPRQPSGPDFFPLGIWLGGILLFGAGCAVARIWMAVGADAVIAVATTVFAVRGARW